MENILKSATNLISNLPKQAAATAKAAVRQVKKAPQKAARVVQDKVSIGNAAPRREVKRADVSRAAATKTPKSTSNSSVAKPKVKFRVNKEALQKMTPAQQRAYLKQTQKKTGQSVAQLNKNAKPEQTASSQMIDEWGAEKVMYGLSTSKKAIVSTYDKAMARDAQKEAKQTARELEAKKQARFEKKLQKQDPARYAQYKRNQEAAVKQLKAETTKEHWRQREVRLQDEARSQELLAQNPADFESRMSPEKLARHKKNQADALQNMAEGSSIEGFYRREAMSELQESEKKALPNKASWLKSLSPEQRAAFQAREKRDQESITESALKGQQAKDTVLDVLSLGVNSTTNEDGLAMGVAELVTMGGAKVAANAGRELGLAVEYHNQAENLEKSGSLNDAKMFEDKADEMAASGTVNLGMTILAGHGAASAYRSALLKRMTPPPTMKATVSNQPSRAVAGSTLSASEGAAAKGVKTFDDAVEATLKSGKHAEVEVQMIQYDLERKWFKWKPELKEIPTKHYINVHGAELQTVEDIAGTLNNLPESSYEAVKHINDFHVDDFTHFKNSTGEISNGTMGSIKLDEGKILLNQNAIEQPLRRLQNGSAGWKGGLKGAKQQLFDMAKRETETNLRKTIYHELGHMHDHVRGGISSNAAYMSARGSAASGTVSEMESVSRYFQEDFAERYANILEARHQAMAAGSTEEAAFNLARTSADHGGKNSFIIDEVFNTVDEGLLQYNGGQVLDEMVAEPFSATVHNYVF